jgi:hypothetical protein
MTEVGGTKVYNKGELMQMLRDADVRLHVLETALRQIAEKPSDDAEALQQIASIALQKAGEARSAV